MIEDTRTKSSQKFKNLCLQYSNKFDSNQLSHLLNIRGSIVHGKAPHLSDSSYYDSYLETYLSEPLTDLLNIVEIVLKVIFLDNKESNIENTLVLHFNPIANFHPIPYTQTNNTQQERII